MYIAVVHGVGFAALMLVYFRTLVWKSETSYMDSPLWLGITMVPQIIGLQVVSVVCLIVWAGILQHQQYATPQLYAASVGYYAFSVAWPPLANWFVRRPTCLNAVAASSPLWGAGACVLFLGYASPDTVTRSLLIPATILTVGCDAILWTWAALRLARA